MGVSFNPPELPSPVKWQKKKKKKAWRAPLNPSDVVVEVSFKPEEFPPLPPASTAPLVAKAMDSGKKVDDGEEFNPSSSVTTLATLDRSTYASKVQQNRAHIHGIKLTTETVNGGKIIMEPNDCLNMEEEWGFALIGYVGGRFPGIKAIRESMAKWKVQVKLHLHPSGWLVFKFNSKEDRDGVINGGPYFVFNRPLLLKEIPSEFAFGDEEICKVPVWIQLPSLPIDYFTKGALSKIGSWIGTPITSDFLTQTRDHVAYARVLVEIDVTKDRKDLPEFLPIVTTKGEEFMQKVTYEYIPHYCKECKTVGHDWNHCNTNLEKIGPKMDPGDKNMVGNGKKHTPETSGSQEHAIGVEKEKELGGGKNEVAGAREIWNVVRRKKSQVAGEDDQSSQPLDLVVEGPGQGKEHLSSSGNADGNGQEHGSRGIPFKCKETALADTQTPLLEAESAVCTEECQRAQPATKWQSPTGGKISLTHSSEFSKDRSGPSKTIKENLGQNENEDMGFSNSNPISLYSPSDTTHVGLPSEEPSNLAQSPPLGAHKPRPVTRSPARARKMMSPIRARTLGLRSPSRQARARARPTRRPTKPARSRHASAPAPSPSPACSDQVVDEDEVADALAVAFNGEHVAVNGDDEMSLYDLVPRGRTKEKLEKLARKKSKGKGVLPSSSP